MNESPWQRVKRVVRNTALDLAVILWPVACIGCGLDDRELCDECRHKLRARVAPLTVTPTFQATGLWFAAGPYDGILRELLVGLKHADRMGFARELGHALAAPLNETLRIAKQRRMARWHAPVCVVMPSRGASMRRRGFHHVALIAKRARSTLRLPGRSLPIVTALRTTRGRTSQVGLTPVQRWENANRIAVKRRHRQDLAGRDVILIDDVVTTGATLAAADAALRGVGANVLGAVTVCTVTTETAETLNEREKT